MKNLALIGLQWGDEGKGKLVDKLSARFDLDIRYQGGPNAGHTVVVGGKKWVFQQMPAGILNSNVKVALASGCVLHPETLFDEWKKLEEHGIEYRARTMIDPRVHLILPHHILIDRLRDEARGEKKIGTTAKGIGPCYEEKSSRYGLRVGDLFLPSLAERLGLQLNHANSILQEVYKEKTFDKNQILDNLKFVREELTGLVGNVSDEVYEYLRNGKKVLFEGAQGVLLDVDHGSYPYVTSSNTGTTSIPTGVGVSPKIIDKVLGLTKAYATRVGAGPFPTEATGEVEAQLQKLGNEFGAATGRRRRCGWLDLPMLRYAIRLNGVDALAITKLDVLDYFDAIKYCTGYRKPNGETALTVSPWDDNPGEPIYKEAKGWKRSTADVRNFTDLPKAAQSYINTISKELDLPIWFVSVGEEREATIELPGFPF